jgi:hypothetical protein
VFAHGPEDTGAPPQFESNFGYAETDRINIAVCLPAFSPQTVHRDA